MRDNAMPLRDLPPDSAPATDPPDPDAGLVARAVAGERAAFEALLRRHYDRMHRIAWRLTGTRDDAEDIVQEVCCALVERIRGFRGEAKFSTWLFGIVVNACHDHHRRGARLSRLRGGLAVLVGLARPPDGRDLYRRTWLASALASLDPALRETVVLVVGEGLTHAEAGAALGVAESTISWRLHEARRLLKPSGNDRHGA
ncbi:RNA polymerase sigma factor [Methylobacterium oryzisoli]|uniref:RNA polymerase sigma factor n=1 Tax=Methylobacterium oryzisoli TaxID=3385502 RepID=UPI003892C010